MPLDREVGLGPSNIVLDGDPAPAPPKRGRAPKFLAHVYCGQRAGWMKMPLSMDVDPSPGHIQLDGVPAPRERGTAAPPPLFGPCLLWPWSPISVTAELLFRYFIHYYLTFRSFHSSRPIFYSLANLQISVICNTCKFQIRRNAHSKGYLTHRKLQYNQS